MLRAYLPHKPHPGMSQLRFDAFVPSIHAHCPQPTSELLLLLPGHDAPIENPADVSTLPHSVDTKLYSPSADLLLCNVVSR